MTAQKLIDLLKQVHPDTEVVLSRDEEGNSFACVDTLLLHAAFLSDGSSFVNEIFTKSDVEQGYLDQGEFDKLTPCVLIWPVG